MDKLSTKTPSRPVLFLFSFGIIAGMKKLIFVSCVFLCLPFSVLASVRVNEIAWMGTSVSSSNEWIELFNDDDTSAPLSGFTLLAEGVGKLSVSLSGTIAPKSFFLLERTNDDTVPGISDDQVYTGALGNGGETLVLKDGQGREIQRISASSGWPAGDNTTKETMQWNGSSWVTAKATPKAGNIASASSTTPPNTVSDDNKISTQAPTSNTSSPSDTSAHLSPLPLSDFSTTQEFFLSAGRDRIVPAGGILPFEAFALDAKGKKVAGATFSWSFGDGLIERGSKVFHAYEYPGNYIVMLNADYQGSQAVSRANVRVFAPDVALSLSKGNEVSLANHSSYEINISGWKMTAANQTYTFPEDMIIGAKEEIVFSPAVTKFQTGTLQDVALVSPNNKMLARTKEKSENITAAANLAYETALQNIKATLDRVASDTEIVRRQISTTMPEKTPEPSKPKRSIASYQYATAIDITKQASSTDEQPRTITLKKPEGFFSKLWHFFF